MDQSVSSQLFDNLCFLFYLRCQVCVCRWPLSTDTTWPVVYRRRKYNMLLSNDTWKKCDVHFFFFRYEKKKYRFTVKCLFCKLVLIMSGRYTWVMMLGWRSLPSCCRLLRPSNWRGRQRLQRCRGLLRGHHHLPEESLQKWLWRTRSPCHVHPTLLTGHLLDRPRR